MKKFDLMRASDGRGHLTGVAVFIFYGDAKNAGLKVGDHFIMTARGVDLDGEWAVEEYVNFRSDTQSAFKGFECLRVE